MRSSSAGDLPAVRELLVAARLPVEDLDKAPGLRFWVAEDGGHVVGAIGFEPFGAAGLLRSLVVVPSHRQRGLGSRLVTALEQWADANGIELLVLLTETAERFFEQRAFLAVERAYVPDEVKRSAEFQSLCPASAVCMTKTLLSQLERASRE